MVRRLWRRERAAALFRFLVVLPDVSALRSLAVGVAYSSPRLLLIFFQRFGLFTRGRRNAPGNGSPPLAAGAGVGVISVSGGFTRRLCLTLARCRRSLQLPPAF